MNTFTLKPMRAAAMLLCAGALVVGCGTTVKPVDTTALYQAYVNQANTAELLNVQGTNLTWTITGATSIVLSTAVQPKQMLPRDPTTAEAVVDLLKTATPWAAVYGMSGAIGSGASTTLRGATTVTAPAATTTP